MQNHEFYNNDKDEKSDKLYKICYVIQHLNIYFARSLGVDGYLCKFKGRSSMRQDIKNKPTKWGLSTDTDVIVQQQATFTI